MKVNPLLCSSIPLVLSGEILTRKGNRSAYQGTDEVLSGSDILVGGYVYLPREIPCCCPNRVAATLPVLRDFKYPSEWRSIAFNRLGFVI